ncbi:MAG: hypothetical protein ACR2OH_13195, partial [Microthrixaceae bacterium]
MTLAVATVAAVLWLVAAWVATVPLYRFKELRPKTPRDVSNEEGLEIRAVSRHARCARCHRDVSAGDVVPVLGWLRGCPGCSKRFGPAVAIYQLSVPLAAIATTVVFSTAVFSTGGISADGISTDMANGLTADAWWNIAIFTWFGFVVASVSLVDARIWLIPWWSPWIGSAVGALAMLVAAIALGDTQPLLTAGIGACCAFGFFFILWFVAPGRLGFGDVRLAFMIGLFLGWLSPM